MAVVSRPIQPRQQQQQQNRSKLTMALVIIFSFFILRSIFSGSDYNDGVDINSNVGQLLNEPNINSSSGGINDKDKAKETGTTNTVKKIDTKKQQLKSKIFNRVPPHSKGKSGIVIQEQLMCHAYAWHRGAKYGGACGPGETDDHRSLLEAIGLEVELPFACPSDTPRDGEYRTSLIPRDKYATDDTRIWIPEYLDYLRSKVKYPPKEPNKFTIAVHIKRGPVNPCSTRRDGYSRYLPNSHYQRLIDQYMQPDARVAIFSQASSYEKFDEFQARGYELHLDHPITEVWQTIVTADVVILSRSSFGLIPSLVTNGTVVYTPFWHKPIRGWTVVRDQEILDALDKDLAAMNKTCK